MSLPLSFSSFAPSDSSYTHSFTHEHDTANPLTPLFLRSARLGDSELLFIKSVQRRLNQSKDTFKFVLLNAHHKLREAGVQPLKLSQELEIPFPQLSSSSAVENQEKINENTRKKTKQISSNERPAEANQTLEPLLTLQLPHTACLPLVTPYQLIESAINRELERIGYSASSMPQERKKNSRKFQQMNSQESNEKLNEKWLSAVTVYQYGLPHDFGSEIPSYHSLLESLSPLEPIRAEPVKRDFNVITESSMRFQIGKRVREFLENQKRMQKEKEQNQTANSQETPEPSVSSSSSSVLSSDFTVVPSIFPSEILLRLTFFHPRTFERDEEFLCTGTNLLSELRDRIVCLSDLPLDKNIPRFPSSYFLIENTFYEDLRDRYAIRYSTTIINWIESHPDRKFSPGLHHFETAEMDKIKFVDLAIRLGSVYYFVHQCDCVHPFIIEELRLASPTDPTPAPAYPLTTWKVRTHRAKCNICDIQCANFVTFNDRYASINPCFWCELCYKMYHLDENGKPLYEDYKVFAYVHD
jgi:snRNA-activating protein complex subunit 3